MGMVSQWASYQASAQSPANVPSFSPTVRGKIFSQACKNLCYSPCYFTAHSPPFPLALLKSYWPPLILGLLYLWVPLLRAHLPRYPNDVIIPCKSLNKCHLLSETPSEDAFSIFLPHFILTFMPFWYIFYHFLLTVCRHVPGCMHEHKFYEGRNNTPLPRHYHCVHCIFQAPPWCLIQSGCLVGVHWLKMREAQVCPVSKPDSLIFFISIHTHCLGLISCPDYFKVHDYVELYGRIRITQTNICWADFV